MCTETYLGATNMLHTFDWDPNSIFTFWAQSKVTLSKCSSHSVWRMSSKIPANSLHNARLIYRIPERDSRKSKFKSPDELSSFNGCYVSFSHWQMNDTRIQAGLNLLSIITIEDVRLVDTWPFVTFSNSSIKRFRVSSFNPAWIRLLNSTAEFWAHR